LSAPAQNVSVRHSCGCTDHTAFRHHNADHRSHLFHSACT
jgi:hypothetical protein